MRAVEQYHRELEIRNPQVTDRALRYRANATPPPGPRQCCLCGSKENIEVGHVDGHEENTNPENLFWTCRSCNVSTANTMRSAGLGRKTRQYNPKGGATTLNQWMAAVSAVTPHKPRHKTLISSGMPVDEAVEMIRATSPSKRSEFASQIHGFRKKHYGKSGRASEVPF